MTEKWKELKDTITELRDNGGTGTQQEVCKFLVNYMDVLEKQMQEPCDDCVSRRAVLELAKEECDTAIIPYRRFVKDINALPLVNPQPKTAH